MGQMKWVYDDIHRQNFYFFRGTKPSQVIKELNKQFKLTLREDDFQFESEGLTIQLVHESNPIIIWLKNPDNLSTFVHEVVHAASFALCERGYNFNPTQEAYSYLCGFLTRKFWK